MKDFKFPELEIIKLDRAIDIVTDSQEGGTTNSSGEVETPWDFD